LAPDRLRPIAPVDHHTLPGLAWHASLIVGHFFTTLTAAGLTGLLAVLAVALLAGGFATVRRATV
jgi:hypothetical protein